MFTAGHLLIGLLIGEIAVSLLNLNPVLPLTAIGLGSMFPDLDLLFKHRKTLHSPKITSAISIGLLLILIFVDSPIIAALAFFCLGIALHSLTDILGGGIEIRQWERRDNRGVYDHISDRFIECRRLYYNGSIEDIGITVILAIILLILKPYLLPLLVFAVVSVIGFRYFNLYIAENTDNFRTWSQLIKYQVFGGRPENY